MLEVFAKFTANREGGVTRDDTPVEIVLMLRTMSIKTNPRT